MYGMAIPNESAGRLLQAGALDASEAETLFIGLVRDYHRTVFNYVFRMVGDDALAEDVTQEAYLRAYRGLPKLPPGANHRAWLFRIATNAATDELRRRKRRPVVPLMASLGLRARTESEDQRLGRVTLDEALLRLPAHHRAVLNLFEFAEFSAPEVGEVLGISPETARKRRQRAREALARLLRGSQ
jgi:RNA polymerase sigma factor (sigma-70 family)